MIKFFSIFSLIIIPFLGLGQNLDRLTALNNKVKQVRVREVRHRDTVTVVYNYDKGGLLLTIHDKPSFFLYPKESSRNTAFYYTDTLLTKQVTSTLICDTVYKSDSVLYTYDRYNRETMRYYGGRLYLNEYIDPAMNNGISSLSKTCLYNSSRNLQDSISVPTLFTHNKTFYLLEFSISDGLNFNRYVRCDIAKPSTRQAFCKYEFQRVSLQGDSLRYTITSRSGYRDFGFRNEVIFSDTTYFYSGDHDIKSIITEKIMEGKVIEKNIFEYDDSYRSMCNNSTTMIYNYNAAGLLISTTSKVASYVISPKFPPIWSENTVYYSYVYY